VTGTAAEVLARADTLGAISEEPDRLTRRFATPALARAGDLVAGWMEEAGLEVRRDAAGNVLGRAGDLESPPLVIGSHLDTVPDAGRFDGALGVLLALAVVERLHARGATPPLEVVAFADEEGARFGVPYLGSGAYVGEFDAAWLELEDADGVTVREAVRATGADPEELPRASRPTLAGYLEAHIEQGTVLEREDLPVGVVSAIAGQTRAAVTLRGRTGHAGTTPMQGRRDALAAASEVVLAVERIGRDEEGLVATVGTLAVEPGAPNVVPGEARLSVDVRHPDGAMLGQSVAAVRRAADRIAEARGIELEWTTRQATAAVEMAPALRLRLAGAVSAAGYGICSVPSGAGHDAVMLARVCPAAMLFVRCARGISHDPRESVAEADVAVALDVLEGAVSAAPA
jgi:allantoate deiminase